MTRRPPILEPVRPGRILRLRSAMDRVFTGLASGSILLIGLALLVVLAPMLWRGATAVVFRGTVEFRRMQLEQFGRGSPAGLGTEMADVSRARQPVYDMLDRFSRGIATEDLEKEARRITREFGKQLDRRDTPAQERAELRSLAKRLRDDFSEAVESSDKAAAREALGRVLKHADDPRLKGTVAEGFFALASDYRRVLETVDLGRRAEYAKALGEVRDAIQALFGPRPGEPRPPLVMDQYGATRWDMAEKQLARLLVAEKWVEVQPGQPLQRVEVPREREFAGTDLAPLFPLVREHAADMFRPQTTLYWQYFIDDSLSGHYFGGVGPEILGTLLVTVLAIAFALPLGVISAAYLVECAGDGRIVRLIRTCINTLAGVPSIVFGLFGLAFFVIFLLPKFGLPQGSSILAGGLTLGLLVLPIIIRASEEAIRSVPPTYKEAALALGASRLRCFVTVTLPAALPGILTGVILGLGRAAGETAPILFTAAVAIGPTAWPPWSAVTKPACTLAYSSYNMAVGDRLAALVPHNQYGMVMTLILLVLILNIAAILVRSRMVKRLRGQ
jgi:phosphate transport system permease protein